METFITIIHVIVCAFLVLVVLLQAGKGAGIGMAFGGASQTVFGGRGAGNFLSRLTAITAFVFVLTSLTLAYLSSRGSSVGLEDVNAALPDGGVNAGWEALGVDPSTTGSAAASGSAATAAGTAAPASGIEITVTGEPGADTAASATTGTAETAATASGASDAPETGSE